VVFKTMVPMVENGEIFRHVAISLARVGVGGATVNTGYQVKDGERLPNTGVSVATKPGDVFFHPSNFYHGFSQVSPDIFWLNIRWDDNYAAK